MRAEMKILIAALCKAQIDRNQAVDVYGVVEAIWHLPHICTVRFLADEVARQTIIQHGCLLWEPRADCKTLFLSNSKPLGNEKILAECHSAAA